MICQTLCYLCWKLYQWHVKITKFICRLPEKKFREDGEGGGGRIYLKGIYCARWLHLPRSSWSPWISSISLTSVIFVEIFYKIFSKKIIISYTNWEKLPIKREVWKFWCIIKNTVSSHNWPPNGFYPVVGLTPVYAGPWPLKRSEFSGCWQIRRYYIYINIL